MDDAYEIAMERGQGMDLTGDLKVRPTVRAVIKRKATGKVVWSTASWFEPGPRNLGAQAGKMRKRYEYHLKKHGEGFEERQERERAAKKLAEKRASVRRRYLAAASEDLLKAGLILLEAEPEASRERATMLIEKVSAVVDEIGRKTDPEPLEYKDWDWD